MQPEPVSPELVLVDRELAQREQTRLREKALLEDIVDVATLRRVAQIEVTPTELPRRGVRWRGIVDFSRRRLVPVGIVCGLLLTGLVVARLVTRTGSEDSTGGAPLALRTATVSQTVRGQATANAPLPAARDKATKASVERKLFSLIIAAPARKLPSTLVDSRTGLVKNNIQVVCQPTSARSFLCGIRIPTFRPNEGLYVRYRSQRDGRGVFAWYGYRRG